MQTIISKAGIEVRYPCTIHLLYNGEDLEYEYKSDQTGRHLLEHACQEQKIKDPGPWGLKFMDMGCMDEQRYWLDLDKLIRPQVKHIASLAFYFRLKVYPPEPYKIEDQCVKYPIYQQLRLDLLGGRLFCEVNEAAMLVALILQHVHGNFVPNLTFMYTNYAKEKILRKERCPQQFMTCTLKRALGLYEKLLRDLGKLEVEDMFLRLACKLDSYGVEPFLVRSLDKMELILWINYTGLKVFHKKRKMWHFAWEKIKKITHEGRGLFVHLCSGGVKVFECVNFSECNYIWSTALDHLVYFTSVKYCSMGVSVRTRHHIDGDLVSEGTTWFDSCLCEWKCDAENLELSCSFLQLIDFNSWRSQLSIIYTVLLLYLISSQLDELSLVYRVKNFLSRFVLNKMLSF